VRLDNGKTTDDALVKAAIAEEAEALKASGGALPTLDDACALFGKLCMADDLEPFLTLPAYRRLLELENDISTIGASS
jgi:hypothetical protein